MCGFYFLKSTQCESRFTSRSLKLINIQYDDARGFHAFNASDLEQIWHRKGEKQFCKARDLMQEKKSARHHMRLSNFICKYCHRRMNWLIISQINQNDTSTLVTRAMVSWKELMLSPEWAKSSPLRISISVAPIVFKLYKLTLLLLFAVEPSILKIRFWQISPLPAFEQPQWSLSVDGKRPQPSQSPGRPAQDTAKSGSLNEATGGNGNDAFGLG